MIRNTTKQTARYWIPENVGSSAISWATTVVLGFNIPVEKPTAPPSRIMAAPVMESSPMASVIITTTGAKAINWFTPCVVQISAKIVVMMGIKMYKRFWNTFATLATAE